VKDHATGWRAVGAWRGQNAEVNETTQPQPEPPGDRDPKSGEGGESGKFYVVVGGSDEGELTPTDSENELDPPSDRLTPVDAVLQSEDTSSSLDEPESNLGAIEDSGKLELFDEPQHPDDSGEREPVSAEDSGPLALDDRLRKFGEGDPEATHDPDAELEPVSLDEFTSDVGELEDSDAEFASEAGLEDSDEDDSPTSQSDSGVELLEEHPEAEGASPFKPLPAEALRTPPPPAGPTVAPLRHGRRRDEFFAGASDYTRAEAREPAADEDLGPDPMAVGGPLEPVDPSVLPAYVLEQIQTRDHARVRHIEQYKLAERHRVGQVAAALAMAFAVFGQILGWFCLLGAKGLFLLPWDVLLGAISGILLTRAPNSLRGQGYLGVAGALAVGTKFAWAVPTGALDGLDLLLSFILSVGLMFGAIVGGGVLGLSLEQRLLD